MSVLIFMLILSFLVIIHELGHFIAARMSGVKVEEFGVGYPPRLIRLYKDKEGTEYSLNWLPFGGFVRLYGEDGPEDEGKNKSKEAFYGVPVIRRIIIVLAGAFVNFVFGVIAFGSIYSYIGIPTELDTVLIEEVVTGSPAATAGLAAGDEVNGFVVEGKKTETKSVEEFVNGLKELRGKEVTLTLEDGREANVYVRKEEEMPEGEGSIGVVVSDMIMKRYPAWEMPIRGTIVGTKAALNFGVMLLQALGSMVRDLALSGNVPEGLTGPVGIAYVAQRDNLLTEGWLATFNFAAVLSINLAIVNVLPLPALDGGRVVFLIWELLTRKRVKPVVERWVNTAGFGMLLLLIIMISVRDLKQVFSDTAVQMWFKNLWPMN